VGYKDRKRPARGRAPGRGRDGKRMNAAGTRTLETHRLVLRPFRAEDAEDMFANWASDPEVTKHLTWPAHGSVEVTRAVLADWIPRYADGKYFQWAMELKETGKAVGSIAVVQLDEKTEAAEIGYCMGRAWWGRGLMPEALRAVMDYLFDTVGLNRVCARHATGNPNSGRVMAKAGMRKEGVLRGAGFDNQGVNDEAVYALLKSDREVAKAPGKAEVKVRFAREEDLERVNGLRKQVNELHVAGKPEIFRPGFGEALRDFVYEIYADPAKEIIVAEAEGEVRGFAVLNHVVRPENPYMLERNLLDVDEFGVDEGWRRRGIATALVEFIKGYAREKGFRRLELNMWEFNRGALAFYEAAGFATYRRYMELDPQA